VCAFRELCYNNKIEIGGRKNKKILTKGDVSKTN